jgi:hypothetical protein
MGGPGFPTTPKLPAIGSTTMEVSSGRSAICHLSFLTIPRRSGYNDPVNAGREIPHMTFSVSL